MGCRSKGTRVTWLDLDHSSVNIDRIEARLAPLDRVCPSPSNGASDIITGDGGSDRIFGGNAGDFINYEPPAGTGIEPTPVLGQTGDDIIIADNGYAILDPIQNNRPIQLVTNVPDQGGKDYVYANEGRKIVFGGADGDVIVAGGDEISDILVGDEGFAQFDQLSGKLTLISTHTPLAGARDVLIAGAAANVLVGGSGGDDIRGGSVRDPRCVYRALASDKSQITNHKSPISSVVLRSDTFK